VMNRKLRALAALGLAGVMLLSACDSQTVDPTPITQNTSQPISTEHATPSPCPTRRPAHPLLNQSLQLLRCLPRLPPQPSAKSRGSQPCCR
jgi:hypothetical protein